MKKLLTDIEREELLQHFKLVYTDCDLVSWSLLHTDYIHLRWRIGEQKVDGSVMVGIYKSEHIHWFELKMIK
jgi:uncharacterized membrane protein